MGFVGISHNVLYTFVHSRRKAVCYRMVAHRSVLLFKITGEKTFRVSVLDKNHKVLRVWTERFSLAAQFAISSNRPSYIWIVHIKE